MRNQWGGLEGYDRGDAGGSPGHEGIYPKEWVLVQLIMEIGVCSNPVL